MNPSSNPGWCMQPADRSFPMTGLNSRYKGINYQTIIMIYHSLLNKCQYHYWPLLQREHNGFRGRLVVNNEWVLGLKKYFILRVCLFLILFTHLHLYVFFPYFHSDSELNSLKLEKYKNWNTFKSVRRNAISRKCPVSHFFFFNDWLLTFLLKLKFHW